MKNLTLFYTFSQMSFRTTLQSSGGVLLFSIGKLFRFIMLFVLIFIIFRNNQTLSGYSFEQVVLFYLTYNIIDTLSQTLFREVYRFRPLVVSGDLDLVLTKPYHPFLRVLIGGIDIIDLIFILLYTILTIVLAYTSIHPTLANVALYLLLLFNGLLISTAFHIFVLSFGLLTTEIDHTIMIFRDLTSIGRFPMEIYKEPLKTIFTYVIPIGVMLSFSTKALFNALSLSHIIASFLITLVLLLSAFRIWKFAILRYQSAGG